VTACPPVFKWIGDQGRSDHMTLAHGENNNNNNQLDLLGGRTSKCGHERPYEEAEKCRFAFMYIFVSEKGAG